MSNTEAEQQFDEETKEIALSNDDKIKIIDQILNDFNIPKTLHVTISSEPIKRDNRSHNEILFEYALPGSKFKHKSKNSNLVSKLEEMEKMKEDPEAEEKQSDCEGGSPVHSAEELEDEVKNIKGDDAFRYFKDNIICFKCNKTGHYKTVCPEEGVCLYCFSKSHDQEKCPQKNVCFRCYGFGHIFANCKSKDSFQRCFKCEKHHDGECNFLLTKIKDSNKRRDFYDKVYTDKSIECIRCSNYGHIECPFDFQEEN